MLEHKLQFKRKISRRAAHEMILLFAKYSNHYHNVSFKSDADVKRVFAANGMDYSVVVERCRDYKQQIPMFENLVGSTIATRGDVTLSRVNNVTGEEDLEVNSPGKLVLYGYWAMFESAIEARDRAVARASYTELQSAVVQGIASIEGYINYRAELWNKSNPQSQLIDSRENKVSFDDKVVNWIPRITMGKRLDKGTIEWEHFKILRELRDDAAIHPKASGYSISLPDLAVKINMFRTGIAGPLIKLHILFGERIPAVIVRARYAPDVEIIEEEIGSG